MAESFPVFLAALVVILVAAKLGGAGFLCADGPPPALKWSIERFARSR